MPGHTKLEPTINVEHKNSFSSYMSLDVVAALSFFFSFQTYFCPGLEHEMMRKHSTCNFSHLDSISSKQVEHISKKTERERERENKQEEEEEKRL